MKAIFKVTAVAALMAAGMSSAFAAGTDAHVEIQGEVTPVSCDLGPGATSPSTIFLGNASQADFALQNSGAYTTLYTVPKTTQTFTVNVNGCSGVTPDAGNALYIKVNANGKTVNTAKTLFGGTGANPSSAGAALSAKATPAAVTNTLVADGDEVVAYEYKTSDTADAANGSAVVFETVMASEHASPSRGTIDAPITFTVDYK